MATISNISIQGINYNKVDGILYVLTDITGPEMVTNDHVEKIEDKVSENTGLSIKLFVYAKAETVVTSEGYEAYSITSRAGLERQGPVLLEDIREILETSQLYTLCSVMIGATNV